MDVREALDQYLFVGQEFLTWLWFLGETRQQVVLASGEEVLLMLGDRLALGPAQGQEGVRVAVRGQEASLAEAREALRRGKLVEAMRLHLEINGEEFAASLRAADLGLSALRLPPTAPGEDGVEGLFLERIALIDTLLGVIEGLLRMFLLQRLDADQGPALLAAMKAWAAGPE